MAESPSIATVVSTMVRCDLVSALLHCYVHCDYIVSHQTPKRRESGKLARV